MKIASLTFDEFMRTTEAASKMAEKREECAVCAMVHATQLHLDVARRSVAIAYAYGLAQLKPHACPECEGVILQAKAFIKSEHPTT